MTHAGNNKDIIQIFASIQLYTYTTYIVLVYKIQNVFLYIVFFKKKKKNIAYTHNIEGFSIFIVRTQQIRASNITILCRNVCIYMFLNCIFSTRYAFLLSPNIEKNVALSLYRLAYI